MVCFVLFLLPYSLAQYAVPPSFGGCIACPVPICQPRPLCPPPQIHMCPPPPPCPPQLCPPPILCPPPPPPCPPPPPPLPPCPPPPPPPQPICTCVRPAYVPMMYPAYSYRVPYAYQAYATPPSRPAMAGCGVQEAVLPRPRAQNDCCCGCSLSCKYKRGATAFSSKTVDPTCSSDILRSIIQQFITTDSTESKRAIQEAAEERLEASINVICGQGEFSYVVHTERFCQSSKDDITCYAFETL